MLRGYSFRPRLWGLALAAMACAGFIALGNWQSRRADEKRALALEIERAARAAPIELAPGPLDAASLVPIVIEQHSPAEDGLEREWSRADLGTEKNEAYALQWYAFAALALVLGVVLSFRRVAAR